MPCNSDYMNATTLEVSVSRVACLLGELKGKKWTQGEWDGYHPKVYGKVNRELADKLVAQLCEKLQKVDVKKYSLEMQVWWRDHKKADRIREAAAANAKREREEKAAALKKLTAKERRLLGLK